jgi:hypothetical protein
MTHSVDYMPELELPLKSTHRSVSACVVMHNGEFRRMKCLMHNRESPRNIFANAGGPLRPNAQINVLPFVANSEALQSADIA